MNGNEPTRAQLIEQVAERVHARKYPGTSAECTICREFAIEAVDAVLALTGLAAGGGGAA